ncbi:MAG: ice-binding family protein [Solirubrobacterales bacterium]
MSSPTHLKRGLAGAVLAVAVALFAAPAAVQAAPVDLATASPFVVLGGTTVTNEGPSVLNGDLGVSPGTALTGFGGTAVVNGATHANDAVAAQAQLDLTNAYNVAAGQPVAPANDLSGTDLGNRVLTAGTYRYNAGALLTGPLTLDAQGDPDAEFVFQIGAELTTESASSVLLVNGASPCNVYWQVGSSAAIGTTTQFVGSLMALTSISLTSGATVEGRMLARNGQVSLINNVLTAPTCASDSNPPPSSETPSGGQETVPPGTVGATAPVSPQINRTGVRRGAAGQANRRPSRNGRAAVRLASRGACTAGFRAAVTGRMIERVVFRLDGKRIANRTSSPYAVSVRPAPGVHRVRVRITFRDATRARTKTLAYRACAAALLNPRHGPSSFTG